MQRESRISKDPSPSDSWRGGIPELCAVCGEGFWREENHVRAIHPEFFTWNRKLSRKAVILVPLLAGSFVALAIPAGMLVAFAFFITFAVAAQTVGITYLRGLRRFRESWKRNMANNVPAAEADVDAQPRF